MPYSKDKPEKLPEPVQKFSKHEQHIWVSAFNSALQQYGSEDKAFAVAYSAVKKFQDKSPDEKVLDAMKSITTEYQKKIEDEIVEKALGERAFIKRF